MQGVRLSCARVAFLLILAALFLVAPAAVCAASSASISATYAQNELSIVIPHESARAGNGTLLIELLNPEDRVLARVERNVRVEQGSSTWTQKLVPDEPIQLDELVWQRVRVRFVYDGEREPAFEQFRPVYAILRRPLMRILGQKSYLSGVSAAVRVAVFYPAGEAGRELESAAGGKVKIELLQPEHDPTVLYSGMLNRHGTADPAIRFPNELTGTFPVRFTAETPLGIVESTQSMRVQRQAAILLTSEKPLYQPSQTIHLRALALRRSDRHAAANQSLTFEIQDPRGNKVFRKLATTDEYGVASAQFALADEVNLGAYHVSAVSNAPGSDASTAELIVNVERYVLPKFRVAVEFDAENSRPKRDYRPGDHVRGTVRANYFFGQPVQDASLNLKATGMDVSLYDVAAAEGRTDRQGMFKFDLTLPQFFAGRKTNQGAAPVVIEATVKDSADHAETRGEPITVSQSPLLITAVPESGRLVPGLANEVFIVTAYPDGTPAKTTLRVVSGGEVTKVATDSAGIGTVRVTPRKAETTLEVDADDHHGKHASAKLELESKSGEDQVLLRTARAVYKPGDRIDISVLSTRQSGGAYIDLVRDGQTLLTRDVDLANGHAELHVQATPEMCGTLAIDAYVFGTNAEAIADHRLLFVQPADELHVEATADAESYLPGSDAHVRFHVTDAHGQAVQAALGLEVVDEAVFALAEKQPGFAKVFFYLEQELMKPRYEIHSLSPIEIVAPVRPQPVDERDSAARVLFSAAETVKLHTVDDEAGRDLPQERAGEYDARYREAFVDRVRSLAEDLSDREHARGDVLSAFMELAEKHARESRDAWGTELRIERAQWWGPNARYFVVRSAGPDREFNTGDDMTVMLQERTGALYPGNNGRNGGSIAVRMEHDRGPNNGTAAMAGTVTDITGAVVSGATINVRKTGAGRNALSSIDGTFSIGSLAPGRYEIRVTAVGFRTSSQVVTLAPRDRAVLTVRLDVGSVTETVEVQANDIQLQAMHGEAIGGLVRNGLVPAPAAMATGAAMEKAFDAKNGSQTGAADVSEPAHVRSYFPEALYINPEIITDANGAATIDIPMADSITTWRMSMFASSRNGALGTAASSLKVFQDFFVDLDLPVVLTQGDRISIPIAVYNYAPQAGEVTLQLQPEDWFALVDDSADKTVEVKAGSVGSAHFAIEAKKIGKFKLTVAARMRGGANHADTIVREIEVVPNGREKEIVSNGRLSDTPQRQTVRFPAAALSDASKIFVRLYPGPMSQIVEGMDGILSMPGGCFEQTSSSTYPNVLALDYMKRTKKLVPEVRAKAEGYIANGYQRLLTFEVPGGGFSWFGQAPANKILTAYGLMEFHDMAQVYEIDARVIERTADWLAAQQQPDGSWKPDTQFINEGATNQYNSDVVRITAYITWALEASEYHGQAIAKAREYLDRRLPEHADSYTLAVLANFAAGEDKGSDFAQRVFDRLAAAAVEKQDEAWWKADSTSVYGSGDSAAVETTGLAVQALLRANQHPELTRKALTWLTAKKNGSGNWGTTQATIMALRALLMASERSAGDAAGTVEVLLNGKVSDTLTLNKDNNDLLHQFVLRGTNAAEDNLVELRFTGSGGVAWQIAGKYFVPWEKDAAEEALSIAVAYDRTKLSQGETVKATATVRNNLGKTANMVMVDLGIPPGFELLSEDLQAYVEKSAGKQSGRLEKFSMTATQAILYFNSIGARNTVKLQYRLRAKYPIRAANFASRVYEYYDPEVTATARPASFEVIAK